MIYPKFPRRTLALVLFFLVLTLGVVGIIFLVYFFNEKSALLMENPLKTIYGPENENQKQYRQNIIGNGYFEFEQKPPTYGYSKDIESNIVNDVKSHFNRSSLSENSDENLSILSSASDSQEHDSNQSKQAVLAAKTFNPKDTNLDTIYIDDDERPSYSSKSKSESSNIDYFDMILVDHKKDNAHKYKIISMQKSNASYKPSSDQLAVPKQVSRKYQKHLDRKSTINSKRQKNMKLLRYPKVSHNTHDDDDVYDLEIDTMGSGSGDFFDDTEINDIFTKQNKSTKLNKNTKGNTIKKKNNIKSSRRFLKNYQKVINYYLPPPPPTPSSSTDDPPNWINRNLIGKLAFYSTTTSQASEQKPVSSIKPQSVVKSEIWPAPNNHKDLNNTSSNNMPPTPPYNSVFQTQVELRELESTSASVKAQESSLTNLRETAPSENNEALIETRTRRIKGNVKKSEERSRQLLLCEEDGVGELCRMLFKGHIND